MPVVADWITTAESMLFGGVDLGRESIDVSTACREGTDQAQTNIKE
jgi:hypothetical protein